MKKARANIKRPGPVVSLMPGEMRPLASLPGDAVLLPSAHETPQAEHRPFVHSPSQNAPLTLTCPPNAGSARANNSTNIHKNRLIIVASIQSEVIARLSRQAEIAYTLRQLDKVEAVGKQLEQIHRPIASYWQGLAAQQQGAGNLDQAQKLLEQAINHAPGNYQARALLALGSIAEYEGNYKAESEFYRHALRLNSADLFATVEGHRAIAILKAIDGNHKQAVEILESVLRLAHRYRARSPYLYLQTINSLAIELSCVGRRQEAVQLARIACASPFAAIYHEFSETRAEIEQEIAETQAQMIVVVAPARQEEQQKVIIRFQYVESSARRQSLKPTIRRAPAVRSMIERVATVAPIHAPPFRNSYRINL
ncbi:MAG: hypothetical protein WBV94_29685 [Blastocatellia bacterium]